MDLLKKSESELNEIEFYLMSHDQTNALIEVKDFRKFYGNRVRVVKGRKVPKGTEGIVFFVKRYDYSKYGDPWGIYSKTKIGLKNDNGDTFYTYSDNIILI